MKKVVKFYLAEYTDDDLKAMLENAPIEVTITYIRSLYDSFNKLNEEYRKIQEINNLL